MKTMTSNDPSEYSAEGGEMNPESTETTPMEETTVGAHVNATVQHTGERLEAFGHAVRRTMSPEGAVGGAAASAASTLEDTGAYLQTTSWERMVEDVSMVIRRYPFHSLVLGFGVGYFLARKTQ